MEVVFLAAYSFFFKKGKNESYIPNVFIDGSAKTFVDAATLRQKLQIKLAISACNGILTPGQLLLAVTLSNHSPGKIAARVAMIESLV